MDQSADPTWTRVQIPHTQMSPGTMPSPNTAKIPFTSMHNWVGDALIWRAAY